MTFQRPHICSTTSLESIRTVASVAPSFTASSRPAINPRYSATLLVARPIACLDSASTVERSMVHTTAPYPAGPGLPRDPPSASMMTFTAQNP
ncbi:putative phosphoglycerate mutase [Mycobacterium kansasii]|uniref:Putative phosphoglycerate mutase n=1 Tax=Mycobacterium kansasii TaxID=1768 RepID=A0A1V3WZK9_MYCKA|nr:putative phosphoglycerate mutase [Mycobacterium kansasii]